MYSYRMEILTDTAVYLECLRIDPYTRSLSRGPGVIMRDRRSLNKNGDLFKVREIKF